MQRFEVDEDDDAFRPVLYVYEIQIAKNFHRQGVGKRGMPFLLFILGVGSIMCRLTSFLVCAFSHRSYDAV